jgi:hypothetical protein
MGNSKNLNYPCCGAVTYATHKAYHEALGAVNDERRAHGLAPLDFSLERMTHAHDVARIFGNLETIVE